MGRWILFFVVSLFLCAGCKKVVVRDANVYKAEIDFIDSASEEQVERGKALIAKECECAEVVGIVGFTTTECQNLAETIVVLEARMKYHTAFMRYLGGLSDDRPPKDPPDVPDASSLCKKE